MLHTVDNSIALTFRSVSVMFLRNNSTVLRSVCHAFYRKEQEQFYDIQVYRNRTIHETME